MAHSPEPWTIKEFFDHEYKKTRNCVRSFDTSMVLVQDDLYLLDEDLERIVACVNACRGYRTDWLVGKAFMPTWKDEQGRQAYGLFEQFDADKLREAVYRKKAHSQDQ